MCTAQGAHRGQKEANGIRKRSAFFWNGVEVNEATLNVRHVSECRIEQRRQARRFHLAVCVKQDLPQDCGRAGRVVAQDLYTTLLSSLRRRDPVLAVSAHTQHRPIKTPLGHATLQHVFQQALLKHIG